MDGASSQRNFDLSRTHFRMGADLLSKKKPLAARRELRKSIKLDPSNRDPYHLLGILLFVEGMHKLNLVDRSQCLKGSEADEQRQVANIEFRNAVDYLKTSVKMAKAEHKIESEGLIYLANIALHFKNYKKAEELAKQALVNDLYGGKHLAQAVKGWALYKQRKYRAAAREFRQIIYDHPTFCIGLYRLGKVYYDQKLYGRAITELEKVVKIKECPIQEVPHLLGLAYTHAARDREQARQQFESCAKMNSKSCLARECERLLKNVGPGSAPSADAIPAVEARE